MVIKFNVCFVYLMKGEFVVERSDGNIVVVDNVCL